jgi:hypothetical protein
MYVFCGEATPQFIYALLIINFQIYLFHILLNKTAAAQLPGAASRGPSRNIYTFCGEAAPH